MPRRFYHDGNIVDRDRFHQHMSSRAVRHTLSIIWERRADEENHTFTTDDLLDAYYRDKPHLRDVYADVTERKRAARAHLAGMSERQLRAYRDALDQFQVSGDRRMESLLSGLFPGAEVDNDKLKAVLGPRAGSVEFYDYSDFTGRRLWTAGMFHMTMPFLGSFDNDLNSMILHGPVVVQLFDGPLFGGASLNYGAGPFQTREVKLPAAWKNRVSSWIFFM